MSRLRDVSRHPGTHLKRNSHSCLGRENNFMSGRDCFARYFDVGTWADGRAVRTRRLEFCCVNKILFSMLFLRFLTVHRVPIRRQATMPPVTCPARTLSTNPRPFQRDTSSAESRPICLRTRRRRRLFGVHDFPTNYITAKIAFERISERRRTGSGTFRSDWGGACVGRGSLIRHCFGSRTWVAGRFTHSPLSIARLTLNRGSRRRTRYTEAVVKHCPCVMTLKIGRVAWSIERRVRGPAKRTGKRKAAVRTERASFSQDLDTRFRDDRDLSTVRETFRILTLDTGKAVEVQLRRTRLCWVSDVSGFICAPNW